MRNHLILRVYTRGEMADGERLAIGYDCYVENQSIADVLAIAISRSPHVAMVQVIERSTGRFRNMYKTGNQL